MKQERMDFAKVLAILAQPKEAPKPLENVDKVKMEISYITKDNKVEKRPIHMFLPKEAQRPMPLVFVPHYEMAEDALELRAYLKKGWAVASVTDFNDIYNGQITDDDLVFNNAVLYTLRHLPEIDKMRIAVVGGSAGGYTAMMLSALQLGICCTVANAPIDNIYFTFYHYFKKVNHMNQRALEKISKESDVTFSEQNGKRDLNDALAKLADVPVPFMTAVSGLFLPILNNFPDPEDFNRWEAFSPVALTQYMCSPIMVNHFLSDVLVPVDQLSRRFTYKKAGESLPEDFDYRLPMDFPGKLRYSLEERLPQALTRIERIPVTDPDLDYALPFAADKMFNLNICDDGQPEGYGSHSASMGNGRADDTPYLERMFSETAAKTNTLTPEKLRLLLERYQGKSVQLPVHIGVDDRVYGSRAMYRREVCELLNDWREDHGAVALDEVFAEVIQAETNADIRREFRSIMKSIACVRGSLS